MVHRANQVLPASLAEIAPLMAVAQLTGPEVLPRF
jgi:hypothetical protein